MFFWLLLLFRYLRNLTLFKAVFIVYECSISRWNLFFINIRLTFAQILFFIMRSLAWRTSLQPNNGRIKTSLFLLFAGWNYLNYLRLLDFLFLWLFDLLAFFFLLLFQLFSQIGFFSSVLFLSFLLLYFC